MIRAPPWEESGGLFLSYLKSCEHETITGGTVTVGTERSEVKEGQVVRNKVPCNGGKMQLSSQQASRVPPLRSGFRVLTVYRCFIRAHRWFNCLRYWQVKAALC